MKKRKGISLIVLIITIIVIIILAGAVILNLSKNNPIESARKARFLNDIDTFKSELSLYELDKMAKTDGNYNPKLLNADKSGSTENGDPTNTSKKIMDIISSMDKTRYPDILEIVAGELVYVGNNQDESNWSDGVIGVRGFKIDISVIPDINSFNGTISLTGTLVDPDKIDYYKIYLSETSGEHGDTPVQEIFRKEATVDFSITDGIEANKTYYIIVEVKMSNESNVRTKEVKVSSSIDTELPNVAQIAVPNYSNKLIISPIAITLTDNDGGSGINKIGSKYIIDQTSTNYNETDELWNTATTFSSTDFVGDVATIAVEVPSDGEYYMHVLAIDGSGNKKSATSGKIIVDSTVPNEPTITIPSTSTTNEVEATVEMSDNTNGSGLDLSKCKYIYSIVSYPYGDTEEIWNSATAFTSETQTITVTSSTNEIYYLHVLLVDKAGNRREVLSSGVTTNVEIPVAPTVTGTVATDTWTNQNVTVTVNEVASPNITRYEYSINGASWQTYNSTDKILISSEGTSTVKARAVNNVGVNGAESSGYIVKIDKTGPSVSFGTNGATGVEVASTQVSVSDTASGLNASTLQYVWDTQNSTAPSNGWNNFSNGTTLTNSNFGDSYLWIKATDNLGNESVTKSNKFTVSNYQATIGINAPSLASGMTPIKWNGSSWVTTTSGDSTWYNYANKQWANAQTADGSMWVWIPRYEYKIPNTHSNTAQTIQINFISGLQTRSTTSYIMHPAFTFGNTELPGIWVAKFEATAREGIDINTTYQELNVNTKHVKISPNVHPWNQISVSNIFDVCRNMETDSTYGWGSAGTGIDTHLMRNVEWGVVAYLTQSTYGKNSEVWMNPHGINDGGIYKSPMTGRAGTAQDSSTTTSTYSYENATYGVNASTTGNVYGVYDMSGGLWEYVAGYVNTGNSSLTDNGLSLVNAESKYKDVYLNGATDEEIFANSSNKKGDAIYETSVYNVGNWYVDMMFIPNTYIPFFTRGSYFQNWTNAGMFAYIGTYGYADRSTGFRPIIAVSNGL